MNKPEPADAAAKPQGGKRERTCVASGEVLPEALLIRFALGPDDVLVPDLGAKLPGRGAWVRADHASLALAARKGGFSRAFKTQITPPIDLADQVERLLERRSLDFLGLMRRAAGIAFGFAQVESAIRAQPLPVMIEATDGAEEGREKLMSLHIELWSAPPPAVACFTAADLGMALGRDRVIHACLLQERLALAWAAEIGRLAGFRAIVPSSWPASWRSVGLGLGGAAAGS